MANIGDESVDLSNLGTRLFAFGCILAIGLTVFGVGKAMTNDGSNKVQKQMEVVQQSEYSDYDQQYVKGTSVKAAYNNFAGKGIAVLLATRLMIDDGVLANGLPTTDSSWSTIQIQANDSSGLPIQVEGSDTSLHNLWCINYNAILADKTITAENGYYVTTGGFALDATTGMVKYYNKVSNMKQFGMAEYIPSSANFLASLVKDSTGEVVGIMFQQVATGGM